MFTAGGSVDLPSATTTRGFLVTWWGIVRRLPSWSRRARVPSSAGPGTDHGAPSSSTILRSPALAASLYCDGAFYASTSSTGPPTSRRPWTPRRSARSLCLGSPFPRYAVYVFARVRLSVGGIAGVGKSCLLLRFSDGSFTTSFITTIGIDFKIRTIELDGKRIKLQIWDTAGQERFRTITTAYYRGAMGILLVYDVTDESSFNNIRNWIRNIEQHASDNVNKILIGNKADMDESKRAVPSAKGQALADEYGIKFFETSAKTNLNVEQVFFSIARDIKQRLAETDSKPEDKTIKINNKTDQGADAPAAQRSACCGS
ncbi:hypothetical protein ABZP36_028865 [Zizania latifolia]